MAATLQKPLSQIKAQLLNLTNTTLPDKAHPPTHQQTNQKVAEVIRITYFEYDGSAGLLLQDARQAEGLQVRVGVVHEARVVVREQSLDVVENETKLVHVFDGLLVRGDLGL